MSSYPRFYFTTLSLSAFVMVQTPSLILAVQISCLLHPRQSPRHGRPGDTEPSCQLRRADTRVLPDEPVHRLSLCLLAVPVCHFATSTLRFALSVEVACCKACNRWLRLDKFFELWAILMEILCKRKGDSEDATALQRMECSCCPKSKTRPTITVSSHDEPSILQPWIGRGRKASLFKYTPLRYAGKSDFAVPGKASESHTSS